MSADQTTHKKNTPKRFYTFFFFPKNEKKKCIHIKTFITAFVVIATYEEEEDYFLL